MLNERQEIPARSRGRQRESGEVDSFAYLVDQWLRKNRVRERVDRGSLFGRWREVVGEKVARSTRVIDVRRGELIVEVSSPALLNELATYRSQEILDLLRGADEFRGVQRIRFRAGGS